MGPAALHARLALLNGPSPIFIGSRLITTGFFEVIVVCVGS